MCICEIDTEVYDFTTFIYSWKIEDKLWFLKIYNFNDFSKFWFHLENAKNNLNDKYFHMPTLQPTLWLPKFSFYELLW